MKNTFTVNGKKYTARDFDFDLVCDLEEMGVKLEKISDRPMSSIRAYFALCADADKATASKELQEHIISGKNLDELSQMFAKKLEDSDFFQALAKSQETEASADQEAESEEVETE